MEITESFVMRLSLSFQIFTVINYKTNIIIFKIIHVLLSTAPPAFIGSKFERGKLNSKYSLKLSKYLNIKKIR